VVRRPKDESYLYMPNPALMHTESSKRQHALAVVDTYIKLGQPNHFDVEPNFDNKYRPDAYTTIRGKKAVVEVQRSHISNKKMQDKVDGFVRTFREGKHEACIMYVVTDENFRISAPEGFKLFKIPLVSYPNRKEEAQ
jgi:hypothetical protein